ncbi:lactadherin-like [Amphiura filiformis]|uniref:lactadherin-like n=1 Tax=Amphiura filiformis TaxID=82378 RepID=UPI003B20BF12
MENGDIPDENINASSSTIRGARHGRLNGPYPWSTAPLHPAGSEWIEADIGYPTYVSGVITQGDGGNVEPDWVTSFNVSTFFTTGGTEAFVKDQDGDVVTFAGNVDVHTAVIATFPEPVNARIVRITCLSMHREGGFYTLRFEILGCKK